MYKEFFGLTDLPFTIVPSSRYIFLSTRHREALNHLQVGLGSGGGFALLTGEVGTGKTTVSKALLSILESSVKTGLLLNPTYTSIELLEAICDEFLLDYEEPSTLKQLTQTIYRYLLENHGKGIQTLLLIDEAQHLSADVLEQLRLLTNLETDSQKLLQILLIGQPELQHKLQTVELRQLAQRITGRYHLLPLTEQEVGQYIKFRLQVAGCVMEIFPAKAVKLITQETQGIPRLINLVSDKCLQYSYYSGEKLISTANAQKACDDVMVFQRPMSKTPHSSERSSKLSKNKAQWLPYAVSLLIGLLVAFSAWNWGPSFMQSQSEVSPDHQEQVATQNVTEPTLGESKKERASQTTSVKQTPPTIGSQALDAQTFEDSQLEPFIDGNTQQKKSIQTLFALWGYQVTESESNCQSGGRADLYCYQTIGSIQELMNINRPAILTLHTYDKSYFAVLTRLGEGTATLSIDNTAIDVSVTWLYQHWSGEFTLFWYSNLKKYDLAMYDRGEPVQELNQLLSKALSEPVTQSSTYTEDTKRKIESFQLWQGLNDDGLINEELLMLLDSYTNKKTPTIIDSLNSGR